MTSQVVRSLERKGLVERDVDPSDTRARRLRVTRRGSRLAPRAVAIVEQVDKKFFAETTPTETLRVLGRLGRVPKSPLP
jgi:DNA-binding MarR family transcriptional regulator